MTSVIVFVKVHNDSLVVFGVQYEVIAVTPWGKMFCLVPVVCLVFIHN